MVGQKRKAHGGGDKRAGKKLSKDMLLFMVDVMNKARVSWGVSFVVDETGMLTAQLPVENE